MSQNQPRKQESNTPQSYDPAVLKSLIDNQAQKIQLDFQRLKLEEKRLEQDAKLADKSMQYQAQFLKDQPSENRKTITRIGYIIFAFILLFLAFIGFLVYTNNKDFADTFLKFCSYLITSAASFWFGRKSIPKQNKKGSNDSVIQEAEVVED